VAAITRLTKGKTTLFVTHQLSAVMDADLIVVVSNGKVVQSGTHEELLREEGCYLDLWKLQQNNK